MKITITPEKRNKDNVTTLCDKVNASRNASTTNDGIAISFTTDIRTSGSFYGKVYLQVSELYELLGVAAQQAFETAQDTRRRMPAVERSLASLERKKPRP